MIGQHRENVEWLCLRFSLAELRIRPGSGKRDEISVISIEK